MCAQAWDVTPRDNSSTGYVARGDKKSLACVELRQLRANGRVHYEALFEHGLVSQRFQFCQSRAPCSG
jgi:hypothetical protein